MLKRIITGIILIAVLAVFIVCSYFVSPIFMDMLVLIFLAGSVYELYNCFKDAGYKMFKSPAILLLLTAYPAFYLMQYYVGDGARTVSAGIQGLMIALAASACLALLIFTFRPLSKKYCAMEHIDGEASVEGETQNGNCVECEAHSEASVEGGACENCEQRVETSGKLMLNDLFANVFLLVYPITFFMLAWVASYKYGALFAVLYAIVVPIIGGDMFAYFLGSLIGGKKLCPKISPKKTVAGAIGAVIGATVMSIVFFAIFECAPAFAEKCGYIPFFAGEGRLYKSALVYLALGVMMGVASELGDLCASAIKRAIGIKDYGKIFPGHGGFLDRIDSVMFCLVPLLVAFTIIYGF